MLLSLGAIQFEELFTLGLLIHFARYMIHDIIWDKVKHMFVSLGKNTLGSFSL